MSRVVAASSSSSSGRAAGSLNPAAFRQTANENAFRSGRHRYPTKNRDRTALRIYGTRRAIDENNCILAVHYYTYLPSLTSFREPAAKFPARETRMTLEKKNDAYSAPPSCVHAIIIMFYVHNHTHNTYTYTKYTRFESGARRRRRICIEESNASK